MNILPRRETAKIYRFPARLRALPYPDPRLDTPSKTAHSAPVTSGAWYHENAVRDDLRDRKD